MMSRWLDHLPPWLALAAIAGTGIYNGGELAFMALALVAAASVEAHRLDLSRYRLLLEIVAVAVLIGDVFLFRNIFAAVVHLLCLLMGLRLALPRLPRERRQLILISFLLFLTTAISTADMLFLLLTLLWGAGAMAVMLQLSWEQGAHLRRGLVTRAPFRKLPMWLLGSAAMGAAVFVILPRTSLGLRPLPGLQRRFLGTAAGLGDNLDLAKEGPIQDNDAVALRVTPLGAPDAAARERMARDLGLLRGMVLENVKGMRWDPTPYTPSREGLGLRSELDSAIEQEGEFFLTPNRAGIIPLPYGTAWFRQPLPMPLRSGEGGSTRWAYLASSGLPLRVGWHSNVADIRERGDQLGERRRTLLTTLGPEHETARRLSLEWAPQILDATSLAQALQNALQRNCSYSLENPSGGATNPLAHFLEVSHAGHCEYFASSLALMLRARGVPARIAAGYRLGPWIPEGGYFLVSQNQAHAWVEYWDEATRRWHVADPTPSAPLLAGDAASMQSWGRLADAVRYRWDRFVVRFSDQDQMEGLSWMQQQLSRPRPAHLQVWSYGAGAALAIFLIWRSRRRWLPWLPAHRAPGGIIALQPLVHRARELAPPEPGETVRSWLGRLAELRPALSDPLNHLADAAEAHAYGGQGEEPLRRALSSVLHGWDRAT